MLKSTGRKKLLIKEKNCDINTPDSRNIKYSFKQLYDGKNKVNIITPIKNNN